MNIKEYYSFMSRLYIHQTILFTMVFALLILPSLVKVQTFPVFTAGMIVFICMIYFFFRHLYFSMKCSSLPSPKQIHSVHSNLYMLLPSPISPSTWHYYSVDGVCALSITEVKGKEKKLKLKLGIGEGKRKVYRINHYAKMNIWYIFKEKNCTILYSEDSGLVIEIMILGKRKQYVIIGKDHYHLKKTVFHSAIIKNGTEIMTLKKGVMALMLQKYFYANTPVLKFDRGLSEHERLLCVCMTLF